MKKVWTLVLMLACLCSNAAAQEMRVFVSRNAMGEHTAKLLVGLLQKEYPETQWSLEMETEDSLRRLVLSDCAPEIAISTPAQLRTWAREGMLLPLTSAIAGQMHMNQQALACCVDEEKLFMAPLVARHRRMAINRNLFEKKRMGYMLGEVTYPVWYLTQFQQIMEEFMLANEVAFEIWPPSAQNAAGLEALLQSLYGGSMLDDAGNCRIDSPEINTSVRWMKNMVRSDMIGYAKSRDEALQHFIGGKTPVFIDWMDGMETTYAKELDQNGVELVTMPYPSSTGEQIRAFELTGAAAFAQEDASANDLAVRAIAFLHESAQAEAAMGNRGLGRDDARWIPDLSMSASGATLRTWFAAFLRSVLEGDAEIDTALSMVQAAMHAAGKN